MGAVVNNFLRGLRECKKSVDQTFQRAQKEKASIDPDLKNSVAWNKKNNEITERYGRDIQRIQKEAADKARRSLAEMRSNYEETVTHPASIHEVNTLTILAQMKPGSISPAEFQMFARRGNSLLYQRRLAQIAEDNKIMCQIPRVEDMQFSIDRLEDIAATFINGYTGDESTMATTVRQIAQYLLTDEDYMNTSAKSTENANRAFWADLVGVSSPDWLDSPKQSFLDVEYKYHFTSVTGLKEYINNQCEGLSEHEAENKRAEILAACPSQYDTALRHYEMTGNELQLEG